MEATVQDEAVLLDGRTLAELRRLPTFASLRTEDLPLLADARWMRLGQGEQLLHPVIGDFAFWALVEGEISIDKLHDGRSEHLVRYAMGETFGEVPLLPAGGLPRPAPWRLPPAGCCAYRRKAFGACLRLYLPCARRCWPITAAGLKLTRQSRCTGKSLSRSVPWPPG